MRYEMALRAWSYVCEWGCFHEGFATEERATHALDTHHCQGMRS